MPLPQGPAASPGVGAVPSATPAPGMQPKQGKSGLVQSWPRSVSLTRKRGETDASSRYRWGLTSCLVLSRSFLSVLKQINEIVLSSFSASVSPNGNRSSNSLRDQKFLGKRPNRRSHMGELGPVSDAFFLRLMVRPPSLGGRHRGAWDSSTWGRMLPLYSGRAERAGLLQDGRTPLSTGPGTAHEGQVRL